MRNINLMKITSFIAIVAALCFAILSFGCGGAANKHHRDQTGELSNTANTTTTTSSTTTTTHQQTLRPLRQIRPSPDTGVPECDEYIKKYEACLTTIGAKDPQIAPQPEVSFRSTAKWL